MVSGAMPVNMNGKGMVVGMNKGILFDVDGTLWDSAAQVAESWNEVLARYPVWESGLRPRICMTIWERP
mgnify:CR=1 FL=1